MTQVQYMKLRKILISALNHYLESSQYQKLLWLEVCQLYLPPIKDPCSELDEIKKIVRCTEIKHFLDNNKICLIIDGRMLKKARPMLVFPKGENIDCLIKEALKNLKTMQPQSVA